jgi:hypothetical protein
VGPAFPNYEDAVLGQGGVVQKFPATSPGAVSNEFTIAGTAIYSSAGFKVPNAGTDAALWGSGTFPGLVPNLTVTGCTLQFEIESGFFNLDVVTPATPPTGLFFANGGGDNTGVFSRDDLAWSLKTKLDFTPTVQTNDLTSGTHDVITMQYFGSATAGSGGMFRVYRNGYLIAQTANPTGTFNWTSLHIGGFSGFLGLPLNPDFAARNVLLIDHAVDYVAVANTRIAVMGDSNAQRYQYPMLANPNYPNSTPLKSGYDGNDYGGSPSSVKPLAAANVTGLGLSPISASFFDESLFADLEKGLATIGRYIDRVHTYARGGEFAWDAFFGGTGLRDSKARVDALYGVGTEYPEPGIEADPKLDYAIFHLGTNDRLQWVSRLPVQVEEFTDYYKAQIDRVIDTSAPKQVLLCNVPPWNLDDTNKPNYPEAQAQLNAAIATLNGYRSVVTLIDLTGLDPATMLLTDGVTFDNVHYNALGQKYVADQIIAGIR